MKLPFGGYGLRQGFEHYDGLVGARHDGFGNGDEFVLLAEYTQPRRLQFTAIELGRRAGRRFDAARLKLREHDIELRAVTYALFDHRQHVDSRKISQQAFERNQAVREFPGLLGLRKLLERDRLLHRKFADCRARDFRQVRAAPQLLSHFMRQRTDVRSVRTLNNKTRNAAVNFFEFVFVNLNFDSLQLDNLFFARQLVRRAPFYFFRGKRRRHLFESPSTLRGKFFKHRSIQRRPSVWPLCLAIGIVGIRREAESKPRLVPLAASRVELHQPRGPAQQQHENARRQRIKRAQVSDLPEARQMAHRINDVVRRFSLRFIDDERAVVGRRLWLSWHSRS